MKKIIYTFLLIILTSFIFPKKIISETELNTYMNDFYFKTNEASEILKDIESDLKNGSRQKVCARQKKAARLGLMANQSLIKAFEINGNKPPLEVIKANQKRWESILNDC